MATRVLVTGAHGQIGSELSMELRKKYGNENVIVTDVTEAPKKLKETGPTRKLDVTNEEDVKNIVKEEKIDIIYHLAAILSANAEKNPQKAFKINMNGLYNVLEAARINEIKQVMTPSSIAAFGPTTPKDKTPDETVLRPTSMYGVTKVSGELLHEYYTGRYGLDVRSVRYPGVVSSETEPGGGTTDYAVDIYVKAVKGEKYSCFVKEDTVLPFMYMPDTIKAIMDLSDAPKEKLTRQTYNIVAFSCSAKDLEDAIKEEIPNFECEYKPDFRQKIADSWPRTINDEKARKDWGWNPKYGLKDMTKDMIIKLGEKFGK